jgi:beta-galactosidase
MVAADSLALPAGACAAPWADGLEVEGATPLATYDHRHFGRFAAATTHRFGQGR